MDDGREGADSCCEIRLLELDKRVLRNTVVLLVSYYTGTYGGGG